jgi:hypothetical protein
MGVFAATRRPALFRNAAQRAQAAQPKKRAKRAPDAGGRGGRATPISARKALILKMERRLRYGLGVV